MRGPNCFVITNPYSQERLIVFAQEGEDPLDRYRDWVVIAGPFREWAQAATVPVKQAAPKDGFTQEEVSTYLDDTSKCPYCHHAGGLEGLDFDFTSNGDISRQEIMCSACGGRWLDVYTLSSAEVVERPEKGA